MVKRRMMKKLIGMGENESFEQGTTITLVILSGRKRGRHSQIETNSQGL